MSHEMSNPNTNSTFSILDVCDEAFTGHDEAQCILYDDGGCDGTEGVRYLRTGDTILDVNSLRIESDFDIESVSVRKGCQLTLYTGNDQMKFQLSWSESQWRN